MLMMLLTAAQQLGCSARPTAQALSRLDKLRLPPVADPTAAAADLARERRLLYAALSGVVPARPRCPAWAVPLHLPPAPAEPAAIAAAEAVREGVAVVVLRVRQVEARVDSARGGLPAKV
jgi:hypothetical protein